MTSTALLEQFDAELPGILDVLQSVPADALDWTPHPASYPLGRLAMHVASIPGWPRSVASAPTYDMGAGGTGPAVPASRDEILETFAIAAAGGRQVLTTMNDALLGEPWSLLRDGEIVSTMTRAEAIARYVIRHAVHHRGQLTVYLRLRGVAVPPLYGDSADARLLPRRLASRR